MSLKRKASDIEEAPSSVEEERKKVFQRDENVDGDIKRKIQETKTRIKQKQEILRKLRLVQLYRNKPEMQDLDAVANRWLQVCQDALQDLLNKVKEQMASEPGQEELNLTLLINKLGLDPQLLKLDSAEDCFLT